MTLLLKPPHTPPPDDYLELVKAFPLKALRNDEQHAEAVKVLTRLMGRPQGRMTVGERDYSDVLARLIQDYDQRRHVFLRRRYPPLEMIRFLMRENGMSAADLGRVLGNKTAASLVLRKKRELSKSHIRRLAGHFKVEPGLFL